MTPTTDVEFGYGQVRFNHAIEAIPATEQRDGNVILKNAAIPGQPAYFEISTMISAKHEESGISVSNIFYLNVILSGLAKDTPYAEVDAQAARKLAPLLRDMAESIERQVVEYDAKIST